MQYRAGNSRILLNYTSRNLNSIIIASIRRHLKEQFFLKYPVTIHFKLRITQNIQTYITAHIILQQYIILLITNTANESRRILRRLLPKVFNINIQKNIQVS